MGVTFQLSFSGGLVGGRPAAQLHTLVELRAAAAGNLGASCQRARKPTRQAQHVCDKRRSPRLSLFMSSFFHAVSRFCHAFWGGFLFCTNISDPESYSVQQQSQILPLFYCLTSSAQTFSPSCPSRRRTHKFSPAYCCNFSQFRRLFTTVFFFFEETR